jgi:hypothetical protein
MLIACTSSSTNSDAVDICNRIETTEPPSFAASPIFTSPTTLHPRQYGNVVAPRRDASTTDSRRTLGRLPTGRTELETIRCERLWPKELQLPRYEHAKAHHRLLHHAAVPRIVPDSESRGRHVFEPACRSEVRSPSLTCLAQGALLTLFQSPVGHASPVALHHESVPAIVQSR